MTLSLERRITPQDAWAYAKATNDENPRYENDLAPPMFAVVLEMPVLMAAVKDPAVIGDPARFLRLVHGEHDMHFFDVLRPGDVCTTTASVLQKVDKGSGELIDIGLVTERAGKKIVESRAGLFIRNPSPEGADKKAAAAKTGATKTDTAKSSAPSTPAREIILRGDEPVARDQSFRYADASGDHNPIHLDDAVAKKAGLPGIILHGLCTLAFAQKHLINGLGGGHPEKLHALRVRFARPVLPDQTLTISAWRAGEAYAFDVAAEGNVVAKDGHAEIG